MAWDVVWGVVWRVEGVSPYVGIRMGGHLIGEKKTKTVESQAK